MWLNQDLIRSCWHSRAADKERLGTGLMEILHPGVCMQHKGKEIGSSLDDWRFEGVEIWGTEVLKEILHSTVKKWQFMNCICVCLAHSVGFFNWIFTQSLPSLTLENLGDMVTQGSFTPVSGQELPQCVQHGSASPCCPVWPGALC